jgi:hypothetical protein
MKSTPLVSAQATLRFAGRVASPPGSGRLANTCPGCARRGQDEPGRPKEIFASIVMKSF